MVNCASNNQFCVDQLTGDPGNKAYAGNASCSADPAPDNGRTTDETLIPCTREAVPRNEISFSCRQAGVLPDPDNCQKYEFFTTTDIRGYLKKNHFRYYFCPAKGGSPDAFTCPANYAFDPTYPESFPCRHIGTNNAYCIRATCSSANEILKYPSMTSTAHGQIGVVCYPGKKFVYRCGPNALFKIDNAKNTYCDATCTINGQRFGDLKNGTSFQVCVSNSASSAGPYVKLDYVCPIGHVYNVMKNECVPDSSSVPSMKQVVDTLCPLESTERVSAANCPTRGVM